jgi:SNF2 family DNA or RNA helicase
MRENGAVFMTSQEVFDLPEQNIIPIKVKTSKEYAHFQKHKVITINGTELIGDTILSQRLYSRMLCGQFSKAKIEAFRSLCESTSDRLIVFYNFNEELLVLKNVANDLNREVSEINGQTKDLTAYENCSDSMTFIQYKAGAMGLNLQKSNKIIYFTLTEEAELFMQSMKRIHRIGQERPCFYYILLCENSVEDKEILPTLGLREMYTNELFKEVVNDKSNFT